MRKREAREQLIRRRKNKVIDIVKSDISINLHTEQIETQLLLRHS